MSEDTGRPLTLETLLRDPLVRMVMDADGVTVAEFAAVMYAARDAVARRETLPPPAPSVKPMSARLVATSVPA
jgi:hypothetical protein